jgi:BirA family transcriptional regulator, biotin operon repressor / biotin---[acetyl-CoA-carboxylase] ligase
MGKNSSRILSILRDSGRYVSGQDISEELGISRTAVWKNVNKLRETGYTIEAVSNRGYRLLEGIDLPTADEIGRLCRASFFGREVIYMKTVDSTNNLALMLAAQGADHGTLVTADRQTAGRGRRGREWYSPAGSNLYMSLILRPPVSPAEASQIPILSVIASLRALRIAVPELQFRVKWPNDVYCGGRKLSGTLCEMKAEMDRVEYVIVGIGMNVNTDPSDHDIPDTATSLLMETGFRYPRSELASRILEELEAVYEQWLEDYSLERYIPEWESSSMLLGREVNVRTAAKVVTGTASGITEFGALRLRLDDGACRIIYAGDATLKKLPGRI